MKTAVRRAAFALPATSLVLVGALSGAAHAATPAAEAGRAAAPHGVPAGVRVVKHVSSKPMPGVKKGCFSVSETIYNDTGETLTLDSGYSTVDNGNGHWQNRPAQTLNPGDSTTASGYTSDPLDPSFFLQVVYDTPIAHEYAVFRSEVPSIGDNSTTVGQFYDYSLGSWHGPDDNFEGVSDITSGYHPQSYLHLVNASS